MYILYSVRSQGWFTRSSTYSSDYKEAMQFDRDSALHMCRKHKSQGAHNMFPVRLEDVAAL